MKAAVCRAFGRPLVIEDLDIAAPGNGEVSVAIRACAICHSDLTYISGGWGGNLPAVFGHEAAGVVDAVGPGVTDLGPGDHVVVTLIRHCGHCNDCKRGMQVACMTRHRLDETSPLADRSGRPVAQGLRTGAFAETVVVDGSQLVAIPAALDFKPAALLACGVITGFGAVNRTAAMPAGAHVVVVGAGGVGINTVQAAALGGASSVIAVDVSAGKLTRSIEFGATHTLAARTPDLAARIKAIAGGRGADFVFVTVGVRSAIEQGLSLLAPAGALVIVGMPPDSVHAAFNPTALASSSQRILGSKMGSAQIEKDIPHLVSLYRAGRLKLDELISETYPLDEINTAIAAARNGAALRNLIAF